MTIPATIQIATTGGAKLYGGLSGAISRSMIGIVNPPGDAETKAGIMRMTPMTGTTVQARWSSAT